MTEEKPSFLAAWTKVKCPRCGDWHNVVCPEDPPLISCPTCSVTAGMFCLQPNGESAPKFHAARLRLVAK